MKKFLWLSCLLISLSVAIYYTYVTKDKRTKKITAAMADIKQKLPSILVDTIIAKRKPIHSSITVPGIIQFSSLLQLQNKEAGTVKKIYFSAGETIKKGKLLIQMGSKTAQQNLNKAQAAYNTAKTSYERRVKARFAISKEDLNTAKLQMEQNEADYKNAQQQLADTIITAPIDGIIEFGPQDYTTGSYLTPNTVLATLSSTQSLIVEYYLTAMHYNQVKLNTPVIIKTPTQSITSKVSFIDNAIDSSTNTFKLQANIPPNNKELLSGLIVDVNQALLGTTTKIILPESTIRADEQGSYVYLVNKENKLTKSYITRGELLPDGNVIILSGLKANDPVVIHGQNLKPGLRVKINKQLIHY